MRVSRWLCASALLGLGSMRVPAVTPVIPSYRVTQVIAASAAEKGPDYLAFPAILDLGGREILIAFKRGQKHGRDREAELDMVRFDTADNRVVARERVAFEPQMIQQMGEWVRFPNDEIGLYVDVQQLGADGRNYRVAMRENRSRDGGKTFAGLHPVPMIDGIEYSYPFDFIVEGKTTYMLVMAFGYRPGGRWSVDVVRSDDSGASWHFVRNLSAEFGHHPINESAFLKLADGFLVTTRGYDSHQRVYRTDREFRKLAEADLTEANPFIESQVSRPRLFRRDGAVYLLGRNTRTTPEGSPMELALFRLDPASLTITRWVILDNAERAKITDGHYAAPYFREHDGKTWFNVITYKAVNGAHPDILRYEFDWEDVR